MLRRKLTSLQRRDCGRKHSMHSFPWRKREVSNLFAWEFRREVLLLSGGPVDGFGFMCPLGWHESCGTWHRHGGVEEWIIFTLRGGLIGRNEGLSFSHLIFLINRFIFFKHHMYHGINLSRFCSSQSLTWIKRSPNKYLFVLTIFEIRYFILYIIIYILLYNHSHKI